MKARLAGPSATVQVRDGARASAGPSGPTKQARTYKGTPATRIARARSLPDAQCNPTYVSYIVRRTSDIPLSLALAPLATPAQSSVEPAIQRPRGDPPSFERRPSNVPARDKARGRHRRTRPLTTAYPTPAHPDRSAHTPASLARRAGSLAPGAPPVRALPLARAPCRDQPRGATRGRMSSPRPTVRAKIGNIS